MHHAGNSSGIVDGAAAVLLASPDYAKANGLKARARVVAMAEMGGNPTLMLNAPVPAAQKVLRKAGLTPDDIELWDQVTFLDVGDAWKKRSTLWHSARLSGGHCRSACRPAYRSPSRDGTPRLDAHARVDAQARPEHQRVEQIALEPPGELALRRR